MELTNKQIKEIDNYLIDNGVKYWDLRLEMIDHYASKVENDEIELSKSTLRKEFGSGYITQRRIQKRMKSVNNKYRRLYHKEIKNFFTTSKGLLITAALFFIELLLLNIFKTNIFVKTNIILFALSVIPVLVFGIVQLTKNQKSAHLNQAFFYTIISFLLLQIFIITPANKAINFVSQEIHSMMILFIVPLHFILMYCGSIVFRKTRDFYNDNYKKYREVWN